MKNRFLSLVVALGVLLSIGVPAMAAVADTGFSDVAADAWYADAVEYVRDNGLMSGASATNFEPGTVTSRAMLVDILYRQAGSPAAEQAARFPDVPAGAWYEAALNWAAANGVVSGYSDGRFGPNDPVTRVQIAAILWRRAGSPSPAGSGQTFTDQSAIPSYAANAVAWAQEQGIVTGGSDGRFNPNGNATRAQVAVMLYRWLGGQAVQPPETPEETGNILVAYFSATGHTETVAGYAAEALDADLYEILAQEPYTSNDLNYNNDHCRANQEQRNAAARPAISGGVADMSGYDTVLIGYPIWQGQAPKIISTFLERYDFSSKIIVPFCTSGSSGIGSSATNLHSLAAGAAWRSGNRFSGNAARSEVASWVNGLALTENAPSDPAPDATPTPPAEEDDTMPKIQVEISGHTYAATLEDNATTRELLTRLPMSVSMGELNGNEKYYYLDSSLPTNSSNPGRIQTGDLMLFGNNCIVLFYESFSTSYSYTGLGRLDDPTGLSAALGNSSVQVTFRTAESYS